MTYEEAYLSCKTPEEFKEMVERDIFIARLFSPVRLQKIEDAINEAVKVRPEFESIIEKIGK